MLLNQLLDEDLGSLEELKLGPGLLDEFEEEAVVDGGKGEEEHDWSQWHHLGPVGSVVGIVTQVLVYIGLDGWVPSVALAVLRVLAEVVEVLPVLLIVNVEALWQLVLPDITRVWLVHDRLLIDLFDHLVHDFGEVQSWVGKSLGLGLVGGEEESVVDWLGLWEGGVVDGVIEVTRSQVTKHIVHRFALSPLEVVEDDKDDEKEEGLLEALHGTRGLSFPQSAETDDSHDGNEERDAGFEEMLLSDHVKDLHLDSVSLWSCRVQDGPVGEVAVAPWHLPLMFSNKSSLSPSVEAIIDSTEESNRSNENHDPGARPDVLGLKLNIFLDRGDLLVDRLLLLDGFLWLLKLGHRNEYLLVLDW